MTLHRIAQSGVLRTALAIVALGYIASRVQWNDKSEDQTASITTSHAITSDAAPVTPTMTLGLKTIWRQSHKPMILAAISMFLFVPLLQAIRLRWMIQRHHQYVSFNECLSMTLRGNFMNFAAPFGSTTGDVCKAYWVAKRTGRSAESATLIMLDRAIGLGTLLLGVGLVIMLFPNDRLEPFRDFVLFVCASPGATFVLYLTPRVRQHRAMTLIRNRVPILDRMDGMLWQLVTDWRTMCGAFGITSLIHVAAAVAFACGFAALQLQWESGPAAFYASFSLGELVKALPGPPQGLGTMELAYEWLFAGSGSVSQVVAAALVLRAVDLCCALPGGVLILQQKKQMDQAVLVPEYALTSA